MTLSIICQETAPLIIKENEQNRSCGSKHCQSINDGLDYDVKKNNKTVKNFSIQD